ncbi:MAG TPA: EF-Tu/IF-2/RF-3 family GTPase [Candidatus Krumholzibacteriaceae bacterium]|nr:EF-Tu/IF-2/RF-3 family GTPase [Candidatus Krumholzibacteriaceae bacterium]
MPNLNVAVLGSHGYSKELSKKGTESDITLYNMKRGETTVTIVEPSKYPEKLQSLHYAAGFADMAVLVVERLDASFGETVVTLDCLGVKKGVIVPRNYVTEDQISRFTRGTVVNGYRYMEDDPPILREHLVSEAERLPKGVSAETGAVAVDHHFNVRGVGAVALGVVKTGQIHMHDRLYALPTAKEGQLRSIQKHDDDFQTAEKGDRVGLALKNLTVEDLSRGHMLANDRSLSTTKEIDAEMSMVKYWVNSVKPNAVVHLGHWMQFNSAKITAVEGRHVDIVLDRPLVHVPGSVAVVHDLNGGNLRVMGTIQLP